MKFALVVVETEDSEHHVREHGHDHRVRIEGWMAEQARAAKLVGGEAFETEKIGPATVRRDAAGGVTVTRESFAGEGETLGGYLLVEVGDRDEAVELAKTWPTGETIEVRPIWVAS